MENPVQEPVVVAEPRKNNKRKKKGKLSVAQKVIITVLVVVYVLVVAATAAGCYLSYFMTDYRPEAEEVTQKHMSEVTDSAGNVVETVEVTYTRVQDKYNILVLGHDRAAMLTDVFMLVNIDCSTGGITVMQIPRDTWISNNDEVSIPTNKINAVFATYFNKYHRFGQGYPVEEAYDMALASLTNVVEDSLCIEIDYSAIMDLNGFVNIVDILGGVEMDIPFDMYYYDPAQNLNISIPAGRQTLNGAQAEGFVRYRSGYATADLGRQNAQKQFIAALFTKIKGSLSLSNIPQLTELANEIFSNIDTDMEATDVLFFAKEILKCDLANINMMTMPGNLANSYYVMNRAAVLQVLNSSYNVHDKDITNGIFDPERAFNNSYVYSMNDAYYAPADKMFDNSVYNGEEISEDSIDIPRN